MHVEVLRQHCIMQCTVLIYMYKITDSVMSVSVFVSVTVIVLYTCDCVSVGEIVSLVSLRIPYSTVLYCLFCGQGPRLVVPSVPCVETYILGFSSRDV